MNVANKYVDMNVDIHDVDQQIDAGTDQDGQYDYYTMTEFDDDEYRRQMEEYSRSAKIEEVIEIIDQHAASNELDTLLDLEYHEPEFQQDDLRGLNYSN